MQPRRSILFLLCWPYMWSMTIFVGWVYSSPQSCFGVNFQIIGMLWEMCNLCSHSEITLFFSSHIIKLDSLMRQYVTKYANLKFYPSTSSPKGVDACKSFHQAYLEMEDACSGRLFMVLVWEQESHLRLRVSRKNSLMSSEPKYDTKLLLFWSSQGDICFINML